MKSTYFGHKSPAAAQRRSQFKQEPDLIAFAQTELVMEQFVSEDAAAKDNISV